MNNENYYQILGVNENASHDEIKKTYRKLAKENHPDKDFFNNENWKYWFYTILG